MECHRGQCGQVAEEEPGRGCETWWELQRCAVAHCQKYKQPVNHPVLGTLDYFSMATVNTSYEEWVQR